MDGFSRILERRAADFYAHHTTVNDLPNQFALVRLGKKVMWEVSHKYRSYQTLVRRKNLEYK